MVRNSFFILLYFDLTRLHRMFSIYAGVPRYPPPYQTMVHPGFPPRPPGAPMGVIPQLSRPPIQGIRGVPPLVAPVVRPAVPIVAPAEKPQTTVYVGKIASTVENEFLESLLRVSLWFFRQKKLPI